MGFCGCGLSTWTVTFMSYNIVQILIHMISMIIELMIYNCQDILDFTSEAQSAFYTGYFVNTKCGGGTAIIKGKFADRTEILAIDNIVLDTIWLILTVLILSLICAKNRTRTFFWAHIVWILIASISLLHDLASIILYIIDLVKVEDYSYYVDILPKVKDDLITIPPIIMLTISSRFFICFVLNCLTLIGMMIIASKVNDNTFPKTKQRTVPLKPPKPVIKAHRPTQLQEDNIPRVEDWYRHYESNADYNTPDVISNVIPRLNERSTNYSPPSTDSEQSRSQNSFNQFNNGQSNMLGNNTNVMINGVPSGTLRRQLPWSYVHEPGILPRRQTRQKDIEAPPVPVPDYTMRLHGNPRFDDPNWSQYPPAPPAPPRKPQWRTPSNRY